MKQIDHPNIVKLAAVAEDEKYMYIVMELLQGGEVSFA
jgi:serine/threonine protein kinase